MLKSIQTNATTVSSILPLRGQSSSLCSLCPPHIKTTIWSKLRIPTGTWCTLLPCSKRKQTEVTHLTFQILYDSTLCLKFSVVWFNLLLCFMFFWLTNKMFVISAHDWLHACVAVHLQTQKWSWITVSTMTWPDLCGALQSRTWNEWWRITHQKMSSPSHCHIRASKNMLEPKQTWAELWSQQPSWLVTLVSKAWE